MRHEPAELTWPGDKPCPVGFGDIITLEDRKAGITGKADEEDAQRRLGKAKQRTVTVDLVSIEITGVRRRKDLAHQALYRLRDDRGHYMAPVDGYTSAASGSIDPDAPAPTDEEIEAMNAKRGVGERNTLVQAEQRRRQELVRYERRLLDARTKGREGTAKVMEAKIQRVQAVLKDAA